MFFQLKITLRNLWRGGVYSLINIGGLAIGMAATMIIMLWVNHERSYDRFHARDKYLYKLWCYDEANGNFSNVSMAIGPSLLYEYAGFANMSRYYEAEIPFGFIGEEDDHALFSPENTNTVVAASADVDFLNMFSFPLLQGDPSEALTDPLSIVLTQHISQRLFGCKSNGRIDSIEWNLEF